MTAYYTADFQTYCKVKLINKPELSLTSNQKMEIPLYTAPRSTQEPSTNYNSASSHRQAAEETHNPSQRRKMI